MKPERCLSLLGAFAFALLNFTWPAAYAANTNSPIVVPQQDKNPDRQKDFNDYVADLGVRTLLSKEDTRTYSATLNELVGWYFYITDTNEIQLLARPNGIPKATAVQLKDKIEYQAATDNGSSITATLPWLSFLFKNETKTSILMQDIATVVGTADPPTINANRVGINPPPGKTLWFITGATVTLISATTYSNRSFEGSTIIQVGGNKIYSKNTLQNAWIISINKVPVNGGVGILNDPLAGKIVNIRKARKNR